MKKLIGSFSTLVIRGYSFLGVTSRALLLLDDNLVAARATGSSLVVRCEKELSKDLSNEILILNDPIADRLVSFGDNLASESYKTDDEALLLCSLLHSFDFIITCIS